MNPKDFPQATQTLGRPSSMTEEECGSLRVAIDHDEGFCLSCWEPSKEEIEAIAKGGKVWLWVYGGNTQPAVALSGLDPYLESQEKT